MEQDLVYLPQIFLILQFEQHDANSPHLGPGPVNQGPASAELEYALAPNVEIFYNDQSVTIPEYKSRVFARVPGTLIETSWSAKDVSQFYVDPEATGLDQVGSISWTVTLNRKPDPNVYGYNLAQKKLKSNKATFHVRFEVCPDELDLINVLAGDKRRIVQISHYSEPVDMDEIARLQRGRR